MNYKNLHEELVGRAESMRSLLSGFENHGAWNKMYGILDDLDEELQRIDDYVIRRKTVVYLGKEFTAPKWANYVAADDDGEVFAYENEPKQFSDTYGANGGEVEKIGDVELPRPPRITI